MNWDSQKADWPFAEYCRFIRTRPHEWFVQQQGEGPLILLLHGAGASSHSFHHLIPFLTDKHSVLAFDLPGHGFTKVGSRSRLGLDLIAQDILALLQSLNRRPTAIVGHSAGAAIGARLALHLPQTRALVTINGAFEMFDGMASWLFPLMAKALSLNPMTPVLFSATQTRNRTAQLLKGTGSKLSDRDIDIYHRLMSNRAHVDGVLAMMAKWSLTRLNQDLPSLQVPSLLLTGSNDKVVPPEVSLDLAARVDVARHQDLGPYGHLIHEEAPDLVANQILAFLAQAKAPAIL